MKIVLAVAALILFLIPRHAAIEPPADYIQPQPPDQRLEKLETFFEKFNCPKPNYAQAYLTAADQNNLDWRLLPAISIQESTCGRHQIKNNWWGWNSARTGFESVEAGINEVSRQLSVGRYYADLATNAKLGRYNPNPEYPGKILMLMQQIDEQ